MRAEAFAPGHITGFFEIYENQNPLLAGSRGCGVVLSLGTRTRVEVEKAGDDYLEVYINGDACECQVTRSAAALVMELVKGKYNIRVDHYLELPMKYGLGVSASGALGTVLALNKALKLGLSLNTCGQIAHKAEVLNKTGLGDVIAELHGGLVLRTKPGAPGIGCVEKIPASYEVVVFLVGGELETKAVLHDRDKKEKINRMGRKSYEAFIADKTPENFLRTSWIFSRDAGLMDEKVYLSARDLANHGIRASMAMLGNTLFTLTKDPTKVSRLLDCPCFTAKINDNGARII